MARLKTLGSTLAPLDTRVAVVPPKAVDPHYVSAAHKAWRHEVLRRAGFKCQGEGPHAGPLHADHVVERRDGGAELDPANGQALCQACHNRKTAAARARRHRA